MLFFSKEEEWYFGYNVGDLNFYLFEEDEQILKEQAGEEYSPLMNIFHLPL